MPGSWALLVFAAGLAQASAEQRAAAERAEAAVELARAREPALDVTSARASLERAVARGTFPGCFIEVGDATGPLWREGFGALDRERADAPTRRTLYDLASVTKVVSVSLVVMSLVEGGALQLDDAVVEHIPEFAAPDGPARREWRRAVTIEHLLTHSAGLPDWLPLYESADDYDGVVRAAARAPLERRPGARTLYSDLDFILLGELVARATGRSLVELERARVFAPLGLRDTRRGPLTGAILERVAATSAKPDGAGYWRGVVEDQNARTAGGQTGHAGLFSTGEELGVLARALLRAHAGDASPLPGARLREFTTRRRLVPGSSFALGWDTPTRGRSTAGDRISRDAFGHTGWTGTSLWIDPTRGVYVVLLSNRVHPRHTPAGQRAMYRARREAHDAVLQAIDARAALAKPQRPLKHVQ